MIECIITVLITQKKEYEMVAIRKKEDNWVNLIKLFCVFIVVFGHYNYTDWAGTKY